MNNDIVIDESTVLIALVLRVFHIYNISEYQIGLLSQCLLVAPEFFRVVEVLLLSLSPADSELAEEANDSVWDYFKIA